MKNSRNKISMIDNQESLSTGKRIRLARMLTNLTRKDMFNKYDVNPSTLRAWEAGINLLTDYNAEKLYKAFRAEGLSLGKDWILNGSNKESEDSLYSNKVSELRNILDIEENLKIFEEISFFKRNYLNAITTEVTNDGLHPLYETGDYVGGINVTSDNLVKSLVGKFCIITSTNEEIYIRKIFRKELDGSYLIGGTNPLTNIDEPQNFSCYIKSAAQIIRRWCQYN